MIVATGPVRVVLLNAGKYEHADVELDRSLHLAGPNNIGKTTLVHTLQFLYVDDARAMHFADKSLEETRRYYFPACTAYVLFECLCRDRRFRVVGLTAAFDAQLADLDRLRIRIDALNRLLKQAQVSDLKELRLSLRELPESCGVIKHFVEQHKASAGADLFADRAAFARAEQRVGEFLEQRSLLQLTDLFQLEFEVTRANGITTRYPHLDRIESNGTSITIKVLTLLTLLRGLMREREGYRLPFFLDEANALDRANLRAIVRLAESFGFAPVLASPDGSDAAARVYVPVRLPNGRVTLTGRNALTLERTDAQPEPGAAPTAD